MLEGSSFFISLLTLIMCWVLIIDMLPAVKWDLTGLLLCISLMTPNIFSNDAEHLFVCLLVVYVSSLEKCLFRSFA